MHVINSFTSRGTEIESLLTQISPLLVSILLTRALLNTEALGALDDDEIWP
jgi:hypothetical protein